MRQCNIWIGTEILMETEECKAGSTYSCIPSTGYMTESQSKSQIQGSFTGSQMESENAVVNDNTSKGTNISYFIALVCDHLLNIKFNFSFDLKFQFNFPMRNTCKWFKRQIIQKILQQSHLVPLFSTLQLASRRQLLSVLLATACMF